MRSTTQKSDTENQSEGKTPNGFPSMAAIIARDQGYLVIHESVIEKALSGSREMLPGLPEYLESYGHDQLINGVISGLSVLQRKAEDDSTRGEEKSNLGDRDAS